MMMATTGSGPARRDAPRGRWRREDSLGDGSGMAPIVAVPRSEAAQHGDDRKPANFSKLLGEFAQTCQDIAGPVVICSLIIAPTPAGARAMTVAGPGNAAWAVRTGSSPSP